MAVTQLTLSSDDVLMLITGAKIGADEMDRWKEGESALLRDAIDRVSRLVVERVDATLPNPANPEVDRLAERVLRAFDVTEWLPEDELMSLTGMDRNNLGVALARLEAEDKVRQADDGGEPVWTRN